MNRIASLLLLSFAACKDKPKDDSAKTMNTKDAVPASAGPMMLSTASRAAVPGDHDGDGLTDDFERDLGTRADRWDSDGDSLGDGWEVRGVNGVDLAAKGASPLHRDLFVLMSVMQPGPYFVNLGPSSEVERGIISAFADAPVTNPDGRLGITVHLHRGPPIAYDQYLEPLGPKLAQIESTLKADLLPIYRYMIWADSMDRSKTGGFTTAGEPGPNFIVTLGSWHSLGGGNDTDKVAKFVHELGHTFGLKHSAFGNLVSYGPNHLSVMNYLYETTGIPIDGKASFTFQRVRTAALDERNLDERAGIGTDPALASYSVRWRGRMLEDMHEAPATGWVDWNLDRVQQTRFAQDLNGDQKVQRWPEMGSEWDGLDYSAKGVIGSSDDPIAIRNRIVATLKSLTVSKYRELTFEDAIEIFTALQLKDLIP